MSESNRMNVVRTYLQTLRALSKPKRLIPVLVLTCVLLATEYMYTREFTTLIIDGGLILSFWLTCPAAWRIFCHHPRIPPRFGYVLYIFTCGFTLFFIGFLLLGTLAIGWGYIIEPLSIGVLYALYAVGGWGLGRDIELELGLLREQKRSNELALQAEQAQLMALRAHLDPHFLFNTLNAIAEWCHEDPKVAEGATLKLAHMLRTILSGIHETTWSLKQEVDLLTQLFELYEIRDPSRYVFQTYLPEPLPDCEIPPMILLPLVENAIKHGVSAGHRGTTSVTMVQKAREILLITITNPGEMKTTGQNGHGLSIAEKRLRLFYREKAGLSFESLGEQTTASVEIPMFFKPAKEDL